jgi:regulator of PEP synthase PpsR (kinase-PPPase family)
MQRTVFFVSDGTAITTETLGHSLLTQFSGIEFRQERIPFVDNPEKATDVLKKVNQASASNGAPAIVFLSIVDDQTRAVMYESDGIILDLFADFLDTLERVLGVERESTVGRAHGGADSARYENRIEATNYALTHDDGIAVNYDHADLVLVGISRSGKTPTCLYMALNFGVKAANYPLTQQDLEDQQLPASLRAHTGKIVGLMIDADRLAQIRETRKPGSRYASLKQCHWEVDAAESLLRTKGIGVIHTTHSSIEEIASRILAQLGMQREMF